MWEHALGIRLCQCFPVVYMLMVNSITLARLDILPEDGPTETETCRRFMEFLAF